MLGIPLLEVKKFLGFKVSKFQRNIQIFEFPYLKIQNFKNEKSNFFKKKVGYAISIFKFPNSKISKHDVFGNDSEFSWIIWSVPASPKINNIGLGAHIRKSRNHRNDELSVSPISKSKSYWS